MTYVKRVSLSIDPVLTDFVERRLLPLSSMPTDRFWAGLEALVTEFTDPIKTALATRMRLQTALNDYHKANPGRPEPHDYERFLRNIGYIEKDPAPFVISPTEVDREIAHVAGPQLVVPVNNARYAINAANARWGNLYDALYGTDVLGSLPPLGGYDKMRGQEVVTRAKEALDLALPLKGCSWAEVSKLTVKDNQVQIYAKDQPVSLQNPLQYIGFDCDETGLCLFFENNGLKIELKRNTDDPIGAKDPAGLASVWLEAAVSTIMDMEDSVAAVDAVDKTLCYENWHGLCQGTLQEQIVKNGKVLLRSMAKDRHFIDRQGVKQGLKTRSLMLVRNVGHLMTTPAVLAQNGTEIFEGLLDAYLTVFIASLPSAHPNSAHCSVYVVKPKMHGPSEVALTCQIFDRVEDLLGLKRGTVKLGIMDEERRTSVNLTACIHAAKDRVAFINTGFLDRTGDEIHTSMQAGAMCPKGDMKHALWIKAYEARNVEIGLACGFQGRAQIGKGMWAMPDLMQDMMAQKIAQLEAGASCAWVPSPSAATLHALHYHRLCVADRQLQLTQTVRKVERTDLLSLPLLEQPLSETEIIREIENNAQGILGYVVRWIDQGVGCSKVPDIHNIGLMEDRATCRISSQALANWLEHKVITPSQVDAALRRMAVIVDAQNANDPPYQPMGPKFDGLAFRTARALIFEGHDQPSGYTEPLLHAHRLIAKQAGKRP